MRKSVVLLVLIVAVLSAGAYIYLYQPFSRQAAMESVLPQNTVGYIRVCELKKQIDRFRAGRMGQSLSKMDIGAFMETMDALEEDRESFNQFLAHAENTLNSTWFDILFGQDVVLAIQDIRLDPKTLDNFDPMVFMENVVLVARPRQPTRVLESLNGMFATQLQVQSEPFKQWELKHFALQNGLPVHYALSDGLMIAGLSAEPVRRCLEQSLNPETSFQNATAYKANGAGLFKAGQTDMLAFLDAASVMASIMAAIDEKARQDTEVALLKHQLEKMKGIRDYNVALYDDGGPIVHARTIVGVDRDALSADMARVLDIKPLANPTFRQAPSQALVYSWQNTFDWKMVWRAMQDSPDFTPEKVEQVKQGFALFAGMELDAFLDTLGNQVGFLLNDIDTGGMLPIPQLAFFIEVKQPDAIDQLIKAQVGRLNMPVQSEEHNSVSINTVVTPMGANMSPAFAVSDGFCTIAVNRSLLKEMLDAGDGQRNLTGGSDFKSLDKGLTAANNQIIYARVEGLTAKMRELANWAVSWMAVAKPDEAEKARRIVEQIVYPLLDGLSMIKAVGGRAVIEGNRISSDIYTSLDRT